MSDRERETRVTAWMLATLVAMDMFGASAAAQVTCRANSLGAEVCVGVAAPEARSRRAGRRFGLGAVQAPPGAANGPVLTPSRRRDALGNTFLTAKDLPPDRPLPGVSGMRNCRRDALDNLVCR